MGELIAGAIIIIAAAIMTLPSVYDRARRNKIRRNKR